MSIEMLWISFFGLMLITIITRGFFLLAGSRFEIPETIREFLRYAPTAALIAIVLPEVIFVKDPSSGLMELSLHAPQVYGGLAAIVGYLISKSMLATIFLGMLAFTLARLIV